MCKKRRTFTLYKKVLNKLTKTTKKSKILKLAYRIFNSELTDLQELYNSTLIAYKQTSIIKRNKGEFVNVVENQDEFLLENINEFCSNVNSLEYDLRQLVLIRLISILEHYLINNVKYIFTETKAPFKSALRIEFQYQELLSFKSLTDIFNKIITKECRQLSSGGFKDIIKYYKSKFDIDLNSFFSSQTRMFQYHDIRHLFVHNLGKTDKQYRKKYNTTKVGLSINDAYLMNAISDVRTFVEIVNKHTLEFIEKSKSENRIEPNMRTLVFSFQNLNPFLDLIDDNFSFWSNDDLVVLKDLVLERKDLGDNFIELKIYGEVIKVGDYFNIFRKTAKSNQSIRKIRKHSDDYQPPTPKITEKKYVEPSPKIKITEDMIFNVNEMLPESPWPIGIHKTIASELNLSNKTVRRIIHIILKKQESQLENSENQITEELEESK